MSDVIHHIHSIQICRRNVPMTLVDELSQDVLPVCTGWPEVSYLLQHIRVLPSRAPGQRWRVPTP